MKKFRELSYGLDNVCNNIEFVACPSVTSFVDSMSVIACRGPLYALGI